MGKGDFADIDLSSVPNAQDSRQPTKNELRAAAKEQLSSSRDDTTDDSDDDEDDVPNQCTEQVQLKEEKVGSTIALRCRLTSIQYKL